VMYNKLNDVIKYEINNGKKNNFFKTIMTIIFNKSKNVVFLFRIAQILNEKGFTILASLIKRKIFFKYGIEISLNAKIGLGLKIAHPNGIIIGDGVSIGKNVTIYHQVTLGGKNIGDAKQKNYPDIGDNVILFAGAKVLGNIKVGSNSIIGANSVVIKDVDENCVYAGIPAKKIKQLQ